MAINWLKLNRVNFKMIPKPTISRICMIYKLLGDLETAGIESVSSSEIGSELGLSPHSIRKDFTFLKDINSTGSKYNVSKLKKQIGLNLNIETTRKACIVGLGRLGSALLKYDKFTESGYIIEAGFDSSVNLIETLHTRIKLYPSYQIPEIVKTKNIELGIIAVPAEAAQGVADRLIEGGIKGIVNFAPYIINTSSSKVHVSNIDVVKEFTILSALIGLDENTKS